MLFRNKVLVFKNWINTWLFLLLKNFPVVGFFIKINLFFLYFFLLFSEFFRSSWLSPKAKSNLKGKLSNFEKLEPFDSIGPNISFLLLENKKNGKIYIFWKYWLIKFLRTVNKTGYSKSRQSYLSTRLWFIKSNNHQTLAKNNDKSSISKIIMNYRWIPNLILRKWVIYLFHFG